MKNTLTILSLLLTLSCALPAKAQKAYDMITYQGTIDGNKAILQLADGYLLSSKVSIRSKFGKQEFLPSTGEPDARGDLRFDAAKSTGIFKDIKGSWIRLKKNEWTGIPFPDQSRVLGW